MSLVLAPGPFATAGGTVILGGGSGGGGGGLFESAILGSDFSTTSASFVDVSGLKFPVVAGTSYYFKFQLWIETPIASAQILSLNGPAKTFFAYHASSRLDTDGLQVNTYDQVFIMGGTTTPFWCGFEGFVTPSADGVLILRAKTQTGAEETIVKAGSTVEWRGIV